MPARLGSSVSRSWGASAGLALVDAPAGPSTTACHGGHRSSKRVGGHEHPAAAVAATPLGLQERGVERAEPALQSPWSATRATLRAWMRGARPRPGAEFCCVLILVGQEVRAMYGSPVALATRDGRGGASAIHAHTRAPVARSQRVIGAKASSSCGTVGRQHLGLGGSHGQRIDPRAPGLLERGSSVPAELLSLSCWRRARLLRRRSQSRRDSGVCCGSPASETLDASDEATREGTENQTASDERERQQRRQLQERDRPAPSGAA